VVVPNDEDNNNLERSNFKAPDVDIIFLVDRSTSMSGSKMKMTVKAVQAFVDKLPENAAFSIISFGSEHKVMLS